MRPFIICDVPDVNVKIKHVYWASYCLDVVDHVKKRVWSLPSYTSAVWIFRVILYVSSLARSRDGIAQCILVR
jgi:hypothetical protein